MNRITDKMLESRIAYLNKITGMPPAPYAKAEDGTYKPCAGNYHLSHAYGGVCVHQMSMREGCTGVSTPINSYHEPKRDCFNRLNAFISGIEQSQEGAA